MGIAISPPSRMSRMSRFCEDSRTARCTAALARRRKRWRFSRLLLPGLSRRSTICMSRRRLTRLLDAHVPLDKAAYLALGVAPGCHAGDELAVLLLRLAVLLGPERDDRQQIFDLREHPLLNDLAKLLV